MNNIKQLANDQQIKIPGATWINRMFVGTDHWEEGGWETLEHYNQRNNTKDGFVAYVFQSGFCITSDYPGKAEKLRKEQDDFEAAVELQDGEVVLIEGVEFTVKVNGLWYSDPVTLIKK